VWITKKEYEDIIAALLSLHEAEVKRARVSEVKFLERMKLEFDANICECGEPWNDTDGAVLVNERLSELRSEEGE